MAADGGTKAVVAALLANTGIAITKFARRSAVSGISSMLAEAIHSVADAAATRACVSRLLAERELPIIKREATEEQPFIRPRALHLRLHRGHRAVQRRRPVRALRGLPQVARDPLTVTPTSRAGGSATVPLFVLGVAIVLETLSFRTAIIETNKIQGEASYWSFIRRAKQPELPVILLEDLAALLGLVFAFVGGLAHAHHREPVLRRRRHRDDRHAARRRRRSPSAIETKSLLLGESAAPEAQDRIHAALASADAFERVIHLKTAAPRPGGALVAAKVAVRRAPRPRRSRLDRRRGARRPGGRADRPGHLHRARHLPRRLRRRPSGPSRRRPRTLSPVTSPGARRFPP